LLLWRYKWIVNVIIDFPQISKEQIYTMLDEMERRYLRAGYGLRVVYYYRYRINKFFGYKDEALRHFQYAQTLGRDLLSDCPACEIDERVSYQIYCGENDAALRLAEPLVNGSKTCRSVPQRTFASLLIPLVQLGRWEEAYDYHRRGYIMIGSRVSLLSYLNHHLLFLALYGDFEKATQILERYFRWTHENTNVHDRYLFYRAAWVFLELMLESGRETIKLRMSDSFPLYQYSQNHHYEVSRLKEWFESRTREIVGKFDKRNGTDQFAIELAETLALKELKRA
jgi:tetratricopeptide (TPR) repeat protein